MPVLTEQRMALPANDGDVEDVAMVVARARHRLVAGLSGGFVTWYSHSDPLPLPESMLRPGSFSDATEAEVLTQVHWVLSDEAADDW